MWICFLQKGIASLQKYFIHLRSRVEHFLIDLDP